MKKQDKKPEKTHVEKNHRLHCINCGELHDTTNCPHKDKGSRCFNCSQFGHLGKNCLTPKKSLNIISTDTTDSPYEVARINFCKKVDSALQNYYDENEED